MANYFVSKDNVNVFIHPEASHPHNHDLVEEAVSKIDIGDRPFVREVVDFDRIIGVDHLVETTKEDEIVFLDRGRGYPSRMVLGRNPEPTAKATVIIARCGEEDGPEWTGKYVLITLFEGDPGMPEPYGRNAGDAECIAFWETHALVPTKEEFDMIK